MWWGKLSTHTWGETLSSRHGGCKRKSRQFKRSCHRSLMWKSCSYESKKTYGDLNQASTYEKNWKSCSCKWNCAQIQWYYIAEKVSLNMAGSKLLALSKGCTSDVCSRKVVKAIDISQVTVLITKENTSATELAGKDLLKNLQDMSILKSNWAM